MTHEILSGQERAHYGLTTTWQNNTGERLTLTTSGPPSIILAEHLRKATAKDTTYKLISYSTPQTIYTDIAGRITIEASTGIDHVNRHKIGFPEARALGSIKRLDALHPTLISTTGYQHPQAA